MLEGWGNCLKYLRRGWDRKEGKEGKGNKDFKKRASWDNKHNANITWEILGRHQAYNTSSKRCSLCLNEKLKIALHRNSNMLIGEPTY